ncbi:hypothetical protein [Brachybacterium sp. Z12]|uniref:hypothetical protein n=1 Tax=Brachybacterium sp. Z12 TaxID=2759167 RepID=UPI00223BF01D|nr:hypothetical protein [Brachybacterium sp. Z12]
MGRDHPDGALGMGALGRRDSQPDTRARRVEVSIDKLRGGKRRPCCFDLSSCTDPELARSGKLMAPDAGKV